MTLPLQLRVLGSPACLSTTDLSSPSPRKECLSYPSLGYALLISKSSLSLFKPQHQYQCQCQYETSLLPSLFIVEEETAQDGQQRPLCLRALSPSNKSPFPILSLGIEILQRPLPPTLHNRVPDPKDTQHARYIMRHHTRHFRYYNSMAIIL